MSYFIKVSVIRPTWDLLDEWTEELESLTGIDPNKDPKAQIKPYKSLKYGDIGTEQAIELKFRIWKIFQTEQEASSVVQFLKSNLGQASYTILSV